MRRKSDNMVEEPVPQEGTLQEGVEQEVPQETVSDGDFGNGEDGRAGTGPASAAEAGMATLQEELENARRENALLEDRYLRQVADFQNFRKRAIEDRAISVDIGRSQVALPIVDVLDDLRRSVEAAEQAIEEGEDGTVSALRDGFRLVYDKMEAELQKLGITAMEVVNQPFNEDLHDAMMQQPAPDGTAPGTVIAEIQKGYMIGDRVLRHARVVVAT